MGSLACALWSARALAAPPDAATPPVGWWDEADPSPETEPPRPVDDSKLQLTLEGVVARHRGGEGYDGWAIGASGTAVGARLDFRYRVFSRLGLGIGAEYLHVDGAETTRHLIVPLIVSFGIVRGAWLELDAALALGFSRTWIDSGWSDSGTLRGNGTAVEARLEGAVRVQEQLWLTLSAGGMALATGVEGWSKDAAPEVPGTIFSAVQLGLGARWRW